MPDKAGRRSDSEGRVIGATPEHIYQAFAQPASLMQWLPPSGMIGTALEYEFRVGGRYRIELRYGDGQPGGAGKTTERSDVTTGHFLELVPGRRIVQSVVFESNDPGFAGEMIMTWTFEPVTGGASVTVTAENVPSGISAADHAAGMKSSLDNLASFLVRRP